MREGERVIACIEVYVDYVRVLDVFTGFCQVRRPRRLCSGDEDGSLKTFFLLFVVFCFSKWVKC